MVKSVDDMHKFIDNFETDYEPLINDESFDDSDGNFSTYRKLRKALHDARMAAVDHGLELLNLRILLLEMMCDCAQDCIDSAFEFKL